MERLSFSHFAEETLSVSQFVRIGILDAELHDTVAQVALRNQHPYTPIVGCRHGLLHNGLRTAPAGCPSEPQRAAPRGFVVLCSTQ